MQKLTVVLTTLNEEKNIDRCLSSVRWADEIIVVDSFSRDRTVELARKYTGRVYQHEYPGSSRQVERGIQYASHEWVFYIDADEEVSAQLADSMRAALQRGDGADGYEILRRPQAFGKWIEHGGWYPDYQLRFFRKDRYVADHREVHGGFRCTGRTDRLDGLLYHYTYDSIFAYVQKMNDYTSLQVSNKLQSDPAIVVRRRDLILHPLSHFLKKLVSQKGYRDGFHGFVLALLDATYTFLLYAKIWEYRMRSAEQGSGNPPITNRDLNILKHGS